MLALIQAGAGDLRLWSTQQEESPERMHVLRAPFSAVWKAWHVEQASAPSLPLPT